MKSKALDIAVDFKKKLPEDLKGFFFAKDDLKLNLIWSISEKFKSLNLQKEDLAFVYSKSQTLENPDIIISDLKIHFQQESPINISHFLPNPEVFKSLDKTHAEVLEGFLEKIKTQKNEETNYLKDTAFLTNKLKDLFNIEKEKTENFVINKAYLDLLAKEGEELQKLSEDLSQSKDVQDAINLLVQTSEAAENFTVTHVLMHDLIKIYNILSPVLSKKTEDDLIKIKFFLAYFFEKIQGNDISKSLTIDRINQMIGKDQFEKNIQTIVESSIFTLPDEYKDEFLLSAILTRLEHPLKTSSITLLLRLVQILIKIDDEISEGEKKVLEKIKERLFHPKIKIKGVEVSEVPEGESFEDVMKELDELIGLAEIKKSIREFADFLKVQKIRETSGLKPVNNSLHTLFLGPPGTGKTTVARILGRIYKHLDYLEKGHLVETDRTGMVAGYIGQTAIKVDEIVTKAQEGVLFIDEAYSLSRDGDDKKDFGNEAIEVLLKRMEDKRDNFVVIAAGYNDEMKTFINSNPGLQSRFNRHFIFDHYHPEELLGIFELYCKKNDFELTEDAREKLFFIFEKLYEKKHKGFGNARVVRNLFEKVIENQSSRIIKISPITKELLIKIEEPDIPPVNQTVEKFLYFLQDQEEESEA